MVRNILEPLALIGALWWAQYTFGVKEKPSFEPHFDADTTLVWTPGPTEHECFADWTVVLRNTSAASIQVRRADVRIWSFEPPKPAANRVLAHVDLRKLRPQTETAFLFNRRYSNRLDPLVDRYAPNAVSASTYEWVFDKRRSPRWLVFEVDLYDDLNAQHNLSFSQEWSELCEEKTGNS